MSLKHLKTEQFLRTIEESYARGKLITSLGPCTARALYVVLCKGMESVRSEDGKEMPGKISLPQEAVDSVCNFIGDLYSYLEGETRDAQDTNNE